MSRISTTLLIVLLVAVPGEAQTNSLRRAAVAQREATRPTPPPPAPARELILPVHDATPRQIRRNVPTPPPNPRLIGASLIAVEPPEPRTIQPHDLVTIIIREDKTSVSDARLRSQKGWEIEAELRKWFRIHDRKLETQDFAAPTPGIDFTFDNSYEGQGRTNRNDSLTTRITARVLDVKPNGVLTLEARKVIELDEDIQIVTLTGACRTDDISGSNTILSTQLADASIAVQHTGPARDASRRGWMMRAFDLLRPF